MKIILTTLLLCVALFADTISVSATADGRGYKAKKKCKKAAQKLAIKKYVLNRIKNIDQDTLKELENDYSNLVVDTILEDLEYQNGQTTVQYSVEVDNELINKELTNLGQSIQGLSTKFIILEEPLNLNNIGHFDKGDFIIYYQALQKNIKEMISKKMNDLGFEISTLEDDDQFQSFKRNNENLTGVYFHTARNKYVKDKEFMKVIKSDYSNAIAITYRLERLTVANSKVSASLTLKLKDLDTGYTIPLGVQNAAAHINNFSFTTIEESFSELIGDIVSLQINVANEKIDSMIQKRNNQPVTVVINFKKRKGAYLFKKQIKNNKNISSLTQKKNTLMFYVKSDDPMEVFYDVLTPIFEDKLNKSIDEKSLKINGRSIEIEADGKKIRLIFI